MARESDGDGIRHVGTATCLPARVPAEGVACKGIASKPYIKKLFEMGKIAKADELPVHNRKWVGNQKNRGGYILVMCLLDSTRMIKVSRLKVEV